ncbi:unnamed protein product [Vitrella brassicaformis CCMP3155]|uniref:Uncharacterized protein n=1 Tax=Vitrella brassicaformis (strain CCMP3155) TaxID=1169540 RepID=A0A0G4GPY9_VITBC|nr:unnamed protein product [Vitrella brassicaformis CCMP3155]|eukprot:CEM32441.1 unnamed protein product [Vitrella brassicaformis CCMP3155]
MNDSFLCLSLPMFILRIHKEVDLVDMRQVLFHVLPGADSREIRWIGSKWMIGRDDALGVGQLILIHVSFGWKRSHSGNTAIGIDHMSFHRIGLREVSSDSSYLICLRLDERTVCIQDLSNVSALLVFAKHHVLVFDQLHWHEFANLSTDLNFDSDSEENHHQGSSPWSCSLPLSHRNKSVSLQPLTLDRQQSQIDAECDTGKMTYNYYLHLYPPRRRQNRPSCVNQARQKWQVRLNGHLPAPPMRDKTSKRYRKLQ